ncbi:MAG: rRNA pseudouridine synthase [Ruminococcaceae bacterium]|nr:rRNA pseudouridine synthase [Oscillospiraceae bacterium]
MKGSIVLEEKGRIRVQKYISECGIMSRRAAEKEIEAGHVKINGVVANLGATCDPYNDKVEVNGKALKTSFDEKVYVAIYKPRGFVTTMKDQDGRKTVCDLVKDVKTRIYPVGRLDMVSEGLLIMTNDGELTNKLTHPSHEIEKLYHVTIKGFIKDDDLRTLNESMVIDGYEIQPATVEVIKRLEDRTVLRFIIHEGRNRQIRKMLEQVGLEAARLKRVAIGEVNLGRLDIGKWRYLTEKEIAYLQKL